MILEEKNLPILHAFPFALCDVLGNAPGFLLCQGAHDGDQYFSFGIHRPDVLLLKEYFHRRLHGLQFANVSDTVDDVSCKTGDAFVYDQIDLIIL